MEIALINSNLKISLKNAEISFNIDSWNLSAWSKDNLINIDTPWEYEVSNILIYSKLLNWNLSFSATIDWKNFVFIKSTDLWSSESEISEFVWNLDVLILPSIKWSNKLIESLDPRIAIPYWDQLPDFFTRISKTPEYVDKIKLKDADFQGESTMFIALNNN